MVNYSKNDQGYIRFGVTTSKRVESSVYRNRLRRWSREFFRAENEASIDINLIFRKAKNDNFYRELKHDEFKECLSQTWQTIRRRLS